MFKDVKENLIELGSESEIFGLDEITVRENVGWFAPSASCDLRSVPLLVNFIPAQEWSTKLPNRNGRNFGNCFSHRSLVVRG
jgi:hypothetical protein